MTEDSKNSTWKKVETVRSQYEALGADKLPLDLISFIELDLKLDLIPYDGLSRDFGADAAILADFTGMYVDGETYDIIDSAPEWKLNRLRFSLGHELGHYFLHRGIFDAQDLHDDRHFLDWLNQHQGQKFAIEQEANEFAGRLLVPRELLSKQFDLLKDGLTKMHGSRHWMNDINVRDKACEIIAQKFGVHFRAISTRLDREDIWPTPY